MQNISWILPEKKCWFDSSETAYKNDCFFAATIQSLPSPSNNLRIEYLAEDNTVKTIEIHVSKVFEYNMDSNPNGTEDMVNLSCFNEPELLNNLKVRYKHDIIFTYIGPTLLIINPYKLLTCEFSQEITEKYKNYTLKTDIFSLSDNPPHIFANAGLAYRQLFDQSKNQAIVISGESGAGKTESVKYTMKFLAALSSSENEKNKKKEEIPIEEKIVSCSVILEAFGNAKTIRNYNSSRFGKYVRVWFEKDSKKIKEADISNYLLEKSRVCIQALGERNYHIFFHFLRGAPQNLLDKYYLIKKLEYYEYLKKGSCYDAENIDDVILYEGVCSCFKEMKFLEEEISAIWSIIASILKIGNLQFDDAKKTDTNPCTITNEKLFEEISNLLSIDKDLLRPALTIKTRITDKEKFLCPLDKNECASSRDSFSKCLYDKLFSWIIKRLNLSIRNQANEIDETLSIGLLDIFGFEDFQTNSLEQFCINFTNEKLQQLYIINIFKSEQKEFIDEGLEQYLGQIAYLDNQPIIDLFDKPPYGIFLLVDESTRLKSSDDKRLLETIVKNHKENLYFKAPKSIIDIFTVAHSAKHVIYNIAGFREKNKDEVSQEIEETLMQTKNPYIYNIYVGECHEGPAKTQNFMEESKEMPILSPSKRGGGKSLGGVDKFLGTKFRVQMRQLMDELTNCDIHFIRCIKPNEEKKCDFFVPTIILSQIRYLGLLDSIKIRKNTYPARKIFRDFYQEYQQVLKTKGCKDYSQEIKEQNFKVLCKEILRVALSGSIPEGAVLFGKTKVYLKNEIKDQIDRFFLKMWKSKLEKCRKILKQFRVYRVRRLMLENLKCVHQKVQYFRKFQAICRGKRIRKRFLRKKIAIKKMIKIYKWKQIYRYFKKYHEIIKQMRKLQIKKKAFGVFSSIHVKIRKNILTYFLKKYKIAVKAKSQKIMNQKKQKEEKEEKAKKFLEKIVNLMAKIKINNMKRNFSHLKSQNNSKRQADLEKKRKQEELEELAKMKEKEMQQKKIVVKQANSELINTKSIEDINENKEQKTVELGQENNERPTSQKKLLLFDENSVQSKIAAELRLSFSKKTVKKEENEKTNATVQKEKKESSLEKKTLEKNKEKIFEEVKKVQKTQSDNKNEKNVSSSNKNIKLPETASFEYKLEKIEVLPLKKEEIDMIKTIEKKKLESEFQKVTSIKTVHQKNISASCFQDKIKAFNQPKATNANDLPPKPKEIFKSINSSSNKPSININSTEPETKAGIATNSQQNNELNLNVDRAKVKSMAAKFNQSPSTSVLPPFKKNEEIPTQQQKKEDSSNFTKTPGKIQSTFLQKTPPQFMSTLENTLKLPTTETSYKTPERMKTQTQQFSSSNVKEIQQNLSRSNEKNNEISNNKNTLETPVQTKISVKEMSKNLSMINLPFRNYPGPPPKPKINKDEETKENEGFRHTLPLNNDYNQMIMDRGSAPIGGKKKRAPKNEDFDF